MEQIISMLQERGDGGYRDFQAKLIPTLSKEKIIGVRTPALRALAKELQGSKPSKHTVQELQGSKPSEHTVHELQGSELVEQFLRELPHEYYDENQLHAILISNSRNYDECLALLELFLPHVDNWATCDIMSPKVLKKRPEATLQAIKGWLNSPHPYTVRFGMEMLMSFYLEDLFKPEYLAWVAEDKSEEYYVRMMVAWFFATALAKQYEATLPYLEGRLLPEWTHKKAIQKACESYRITAEQKAYLRTLR